MNEERLTFCANLFFDLNFIDPDVLNCLFLINKRINALMKTRVETTIVAFINYHKVPVLQVENFKYISRRGGEVLLYINSGDRTRLGERRVTIEMSYTEASKIVNVWSTLPGRTTHHEYHFTSVTVTSCPNIFFLLREKYNSKVKGIVQSVRYPLKEILNHYF